MRKGKVIVVGGIPNPIGGVTIFLSRLLQRDYRSIRFLLDCYPGEKVKISNHCDEKVLALGSKVNLITWFYLNVFKFNDDIVFFNFSNIHSLILTLFLPKLGRGWRVMLHHGDLAVDSFLMRLIYRVSLRRFDVVYSLSNSQMELYKKLGVKSLIRTKSYVNASKPSISRDVYEFVAKLKKGHNKIFVSSGFATSIYNHELNIDLFLTDEFKDYCLVIFLYGSGDRNALRERTMQANNIIIMEDCSEVYFNQVLSMSDCYLRPTLVDSFGVAVADAINFGVTAICSSVCDRYPGAVTFPSWDVLMYHDIVLNYSEKKGRTVNEEEVIKYLFPGVV